ncbi:hypothetical protein DPMN_048940 [Dreissena polymorpha]|uniref:Uncharacterized protein n=1 Tax=Dreissena polymorpha TaxID=45954 RepID=A0A9D4DEA8_DREPO|nr:hypothetical protein DPMN_048940 [Dreissena polymorpha]
MYVMAEEVMSEVVVNESVVKGVVCSVWGMSVVNNELSEVLIRECVMSPWVSKSVKFEIRERSVMSLSVNETVSERCSERMSMWMMSGWMMGDGLWMMSEEWYGSSERGSSKWVSELGSLLVNEYGMSKSLVSEVWVSGGSEFPVIHEGENERGSPLLSASVSESVRIEFVSEVCMNWRKMGEVMSKSVICDKGMSESLLSECVSESVSEWWVSEWVSEVVVMSELVMSESVVNNWWVISEVQVLSKLVSVLVSEECVGCCVSEWISELGIRERFVMSGGYVLNESVNESVSESVICELGLLYEMVSNWLVISEYVMILEYVMNEWQMSELVNSELVSKWVCREVVSPWLRRLSKSVGEIKYARESNVLQ